MASRSPADTAAPLDVLLAAVPSLPRALLARLTARMIERLDELDCDPDHEPEEDCCDAGDDIIRSGASPADRWCYDLQRAGAGSDDDAEPWRAAAFDRDQSPRPSANYNRPMRRTKPKAPIAGNVGPLVPIPGLFAR